MPASSSVLDGINISTPIASAVLRVGTGVLLFVMHGLEGVLQGWAFCWKQQPWGWVDLLTQVGFPIPHILAPAAALTIAMVGVFWTLGFLTRLFAFLMIPVAGCGLLICERLNSEPHAIECWLVLFISIALMMIGSGALSLDGLFSLGSQLKNGKKNSNRLSI
jgi:uncharacterized membrane protein YphA (DoxX/SURF4 family)